MEKTLFEKIADKEIPSFTIWEDDNYMAFLTIEPYTEGHTLVIPKRNPGDYIFKMDSSVYSGLMEATQKVAKLLDSKIQSDRLVVLVQGFEVPHVHVHLIPSTYSSNVHNFVGKKASMEELTKVFEKITQ